MSDSDLGPKLEVFKIINEHYRNDFHLFWQRTNFFLLVDAGLVGFFVTKAFDLSSHRVFTLLSCLAGAALSVIWFLVAISSLRWISIWRREVVRIDEDINPYRTFSVGEEIKPAAWKFHLHLRPEVVSSWIPILFVLVWLYLAFFPLIKSAS